MNNTVGVLAGILVLSTSSAAMAAPDLIAIGKISGNRSDRSKATKDNLENGVAGNLLGGLGSGLGYAGDNIFVAVPDRGPNAVSYDDAIDSTASYINRFQTFRLELKKSKKGADLPFSLDPDLLDTTLLYTREDLAYGTGVGLNVGDGTPELNGNHVHYFTGRSDNFDPAHLSTLASDGRFDPESIRVSRNGKHVFISDEYGPYVYEFDRFTGRRVRAFTLPDTFGISNLSPVGATEISGNTSGRVTNKGMEGLAISPDGHTLFGCMQSALIQDGGTGAAYTRIIKVDIETNETVQYAYPLNNIGTAKKPKYPTVSDCLAINDHELLMDERDGQGLGDNSTASYKMIYHVDLTGAADVSSLSGSADLGTHAIAKDAFMDVVATLKAHGLDATNIPAKLEGLAFGPDVKLDGSWVHTLFLANDNDFIGTVTDTNHPDGFDNPNQFFVFAVSPDLVPDFVAQEFADDDDNWWGGWGDRDHHDHD